MSKKKKSTIKLYKPTRQNYVETAKSLMRGAEYIGEAKVILPPKKNA